MRVQSRMEAVQSIARRPRIYLLTVSITIWKVFRDRKCRLNIFGEELSLKILASNDFRLEMLTVVDELLIFCFASMAMRLPVFNTACEEHHK